MHGIVLLILASDDAAPCRDPDLGGVVVVCVSFNASQQLAEKDGQLLHPQFIPLAKSRFLVVASGDLDFGVVLKVPKKSRAAIASAVKNRF